MDVVGLPTTLPKHSRFASLASVLARAVDTGELEGPHALQVLRHQLRIMNTNSALKAPLRSERAQAVIDSHAAAGTVIPKNGSPDALHCDHVHPLTVDDLRRLTTTAEWLEALPRLTEVVCVTAAENYSLQPHEAAGLAGWDKYEAAAIALREVASAHGPASRSRWSPSK